MRDLRTPGMRSLRLPVLAITDMLVTMVTKEDKLVAFSRKQKLGFDTPVK